MPWDTQSQNDDGKVLVNSGYSFDNKSDTTVFIITDSDDKTGHQHVVIDDNGNEIYNNWNDNH
ncbi:hypothetical protein EOM27_02805 [Candidatus Saccharibacteria bacterium]|jgi:hypothetical protein|nr:hypothetical protein [Candidatus Saccharibacteria bacterium]NCU43848.1 hypothetical protein [Candidatus Saccharibacteria bacterium]